MSAPTPPPPGASRFIPPTPKPLALPRRGVSGLRLSRRVLGPSEVSQEAHRTIEAVISVTRSPFREGRELRDDEIEELTRQLRGLESQLAERERAVEDLLAQLSDRERDLAELEALLVARQRVIDAARRAAPVASAGGSQEERAALEQLKQELEKREARVREQHDALREREAYLEEAEGKLFEKVQQQQERETELDQKADELRAQERRLRLKEAASDPAAAAALEAEERARRENFDELRE